MPHRRMLPLLAGEPATLPNFWMRRCPLALPCAMRRLFFLHSLWGLGAMPLLSVASWGGAPVWLCILCVPGWSGAPPPFLLPFHPTQHLLKGVPVLLCQSALHRQLLPWPTNFYWWCCAITQFCTNFVWFTCPGCEAYWSKLQGMGFLPQSAACWQMPAALHRCSLLALSLSRTRTTLGAGQR